MDINEFCRILRVERSPFVERLFSMFDSNLSGQIDLKEFIIGLANVGTEARENKVKFAFQARVGTKNPMPQPLSAAPRPVCLR